MDADAIKHTVAIADADAHADIHTITDTVADTVPDTHFDCVAERDTHHVRFRRVLIKTPDQ